MGGEFVTFVTIVTCYVFLINQQNQVENINPSLM